MPQPALMLSSRHALTHAVATPARSGLPGAQSAPGSVSGDSLSSESVVPVYSGDRLALCVGEVDINLENDPQFRHLSHQWNQAFERALREGSKELETDRP